MSVGDTMKFLLSLFCAALLLSGCSGGSGSANNKYPIIESVGNEVTPTFDMIKIPEAPGILVVKDDLVTIDYSNSNLGYITVKTNKPDHERLKLQIIKGEEKYTYDINIEESYISYPLNMSDGEYNLRVLENVGGDNYAQKLSKNISVTLDNPNYPFLYPSYIVDYTIKTKAIQKSFELCEGATSDLERVYRVYEWIVKNVKYDWNKVEEVQGKFVLPIIDETLEIQTGICFDYAALMTCMLRVQQIPTKLITGYVDLGYHAWIEVYIEDVGWINPEIYFKSEEWTRMDPTFDASGENYKGNYETKYQY